MTNVLGQAFHDQESPYDLYRDVYKSIDCGPMVGFLVAWTECNDNGEGGPHNPGDVDKEKWYYGDELRKLGTNWTALDDWNVKVLKISVSSIVEGVDQCTETQFVECCNVDAETIRDDFWTAVHWVNEDAQAIWDETHGCEKCAELMDFVAWIPGETPCRTDCPECQGNGVVI